MIVKSTNHNNNVFLRSFLNNGINTIFTFIFGIFSSVLFTRIFGIEIFGSFTLIASYITIFFSISTFGILSGFKRESIWFVSNKKNIGGYIFLIFIFSFLISIFFAIVFYIFKDPIFDYFDISNDLLNPIIFYFICHIIFFVPASIFLYVFEAYQDIFPITYINFSANALKLLAILIIGYTFTDLYGGIVAYFLVSNFIILIISFVKLLNNYHLKLNYKLIKNSYKNFSNAIKFSVGLFPLTISEIILGNLGIILLGKYSDIEDVGYFRILLIFYLLLNFIPTFFGKVLSPMITKFFFKKKYSQILKYYNISFKISMSISVPVIIIFGFFAKQLLSIYGIESNSLIISFWILLLTNIFLIGSLLGTVFSAYNKPNLISFFLVLGSIINLIFSYALIPDFGIYGACIAILISNIITQVSMHIYAIYILKFKVEVIPIFKVLTNGFILLVFLYFTDSIESGVLVKIGILILGLLIFFVVSSINNIFNPNDYKSFINVINQITNQKLRFFLKKILILFFKPIIN